MTYYLTTLKDVAGNNYLGINIPSGIIDPFLNQLEDILEDDFDEYVALQKNRDGGHYHITVMPVMEYNRLSKNMGIDKFVNSLEVIFKHSINDIKLMGIGTAANGANQTYFIVCKSDTLEQIRNRYELPNHDFHITIGFKWKDVFGVRKNEVMKKDSKFIQILSQGYLEKENFNFLKKISNYEDNPDLEIIPIDITKNSIKIKVDNNVMDIGIIDDKLRIVAKYIDEKDLKRMPTTEIISILAKNKK